MSKHIIYKQCIIYLLYMNTKSIITLSPNQYSKFKNLKLANMQVNKVNMFNPCMIYNFYIAATQLISMSNPCLDKGSTSLDLQL